ncbi:hypothetical protein BHE74_00030658 [Ensete ventricosum]|nr:hypothetical protein BHE74_00030658 [Ensete ventricosum]
MKTIILARSAHDRPMRSQRSSSALCRVIRDTRPRVRTHRPRISATRACHATTACRRTSSVRSVYIYIEHHHNEY